MRLVICVQYAALAATVMVLLGTTSGTSEERVDPERWIVVGTNGEVLDVDPTPYVLARRRQIKELEDQQPRDASNTNGESVVATDDVVDANGASTGTSDPPANAQPLPPYTAAEIGFFDDDEVEAGSDRFIVEDVERIVIPEVDLDGQVLVRTEELRKIMREVDDGFFDDDEEDTTESVSSSPIIPEISMVDIQIESYDEVAVMDGATDDEYDEIDAAWRSLGRKHHPVKPEGYETLVTGLSHAFDDDDTPSIQGSIVFAELSCLFVALIGYLVHSIRLWETFSRGQKGCLVVAFTATSLYQFVVVAWYLDAVGAEIMLNVSSLITRMISLGMIPITTSSFLSQSPDPTAPMEPSQDPSEHKTKPNTSRHRHRARCN